MSVPAIYLISAPNDGYGTGVVLASSEAEARQKFWDLWITQTRPNGDHLDYHTDPSELEVTDLGDWYIGADGEGNLEV
jgi:hypothetical protein